jgi:hypothetical protein
MELTSSLDAEVSSKEAACSDEPCASDRLDEAISEAAVATCSAPLLKSRTALSNAWLVLRTAVYSRPPPAAVEQIRKIQSADWDRPIDWATPNRMGIPIKKAPVRANFVPIVIFDCCKVPFLLGEAVQELYRQKSSVV